MRFKLRSSPQFCSGRAPALNRVWLAFALTVPLAAVLGIEWSQRADLLTTIRWVADNPALFLLNYLLMFFANLLFLALTNCLYFSFGLLMAVAASLAAINFYKLRFLGEPFFPWDILLCKQLVNIWPFLAREMSSGYLLLLLGLFTVLFLLRRFRPTCFLTAKHRVLFGAAALLFLISMAFSRSSPISVVLTKLEVQNNVFQQRINYQHNGIALAFALNFENVLILPPPHYSPETISAIVRQIKKQYPADKKVPGQVLKQMTGQVVSPVPGQAPSQAPGQEAGQVPGQAPSQASGQAPGQVPGQEAGQAPSRVSRQIPGQSRSPALRPNIIVVMDEAFWDPTKMGTLGFSSEPLPAIRALEKTNALGALVSPEFGGNTANVEFEVLTGFSTSFLPKGSVAYQQYIKKPLPSLASLLRGSGYRSIAIHPYDKWYWNRDQVYKYLGFEQFISKSEFSRPEYRGFFISDQEVARRIISETDKATKPVFIFAVTMQNHGAYNDNRYKTTKIRVRGDLSPESRHVLENYTQGAADADQSLRLLIKHYEQVKQPTMLIFFGDHLPYLGKNYQAYLEAKYISTGQEDLWGLAEYRRMRTVPLVVWSNYTTVTPPARPVSASFLGPLLLQTAGIKEPLYYRYLQGFQQKSPNFPLERANAQAAEQYWQLQYDLMFGSQYSRNELFAGVPGRQ